jgi:hypothetical protein
MHWACMWSLVKLELSSIMYFINNCFKIGHSITPKKEQKTWNNNEEMVELGLKAGKNERDSKRVRSWLWWRSGLHCTLEQSSLLHGMRAGGWFCWSRQMILPFPTICVNAFLLFIKGGKFYRKTLEERIYSTDFLQLLRNDSMTVCNINKVYQMWSYNRPAGRERGIISASQWFEVGQP